MPRRPLWKAFFVLLAATASPGRAQTNMCQNSDPGTEQPASHNCGLPSNQDPTPLIRDVSDRVIAIAQGMKGQYRLAWTPKILMTDEVRPEEMARAMNPSADEISRGEPGAIAISSSLCLLFASRDEVAFLVGHELGHQVLRTWQTVEDGKKAAEAACKERSRCGQSRCSIDACEEERTYALLQKEESRADEVGMAYVAASKDQADPASRFDPGKACLMFGHVRDYWWAHGANFDDAVPDHPPLAQREYEARKKIEQLLPPQ